MGLNDLKVKQMFIKCSFQKRKKGENLEVVQQFIKTILVRYKINSISKCLSLYVNDIHVMIFSKISYRKMRKTIV